MPPELDNYTEKLHSSPWFLMHNKNKFMHVGLRSPTVQTTCIKRTISKLKGTPHFQLVSQHFSSKNYKLTR